MKIEGIKITLKCGRCKDGEVREKIFELPSGEKIKPYKTETKKTPYPHDICYYKLQPGKRYLLTTQVFTKNGMRGTLKQVIEVNESGLQVISEEHEGNLPASYIKHLSAP
jgi:hypothetical protein